MPRFYFDTEDGGPHRDNEGLELPDREAARREALGALPDMAREEMPDGGNERVFRCNVRDEKDKVIFVATLTLKADWADRG